ncbi:MAG: hypothetical protein ACFCUO_00075 [Rhodospirillales bacterium]
MPSGLAGRLAGGLAAVAAIGLLALAVPRTISSLLMLPSAAEATRADGPRPMALDDPHAAIAALRRRLALAPADPYGWTRLAYAESRLDGWSPRALSALRLAILSAPYEPRLTAARLRLSFAAWPHMAPEDRQLVFRQIRFGFQDAPHDLAVLAVDLGVVDLVRAALLASPEDLARFEWSLATLAP